MKQPHTFQDKKQQKKQRRLLLHRQKPTLRNKTWKAYLFLLPSLLGVSTFVFIPFLDAFRRSFCEAMSDTFVGFDNYKLVLQNEAFLLASKNTGRFLLLCIPVLLVISLLFTVALHSLKKYSEGFKTIYLIPMAIPVASVVLLWKVFFHKNGLIGNFLEGMGLERIDFMNSNYAFSVLVFSYIWKNTGYDMVLWLAGLSGISESLYEAAKVDGAGAFARFRYITFPGLLPTLSMTAVLSFVNSFKVFREAYLIAGNYPHDSIYMLQHLFNNWFVSLDVQKMCAAAVLMAAVLFTLLLLLQNIDRKEP